MKHDEIFERLKPPPGGLAVLRSRMNARRGHSVYRFAPIAFAGIAAVALLVVNRKDTFDVAATLGQNGDMSAIALGLAPMPKGGVAVDGDSRGTTALLEVPTSNPNVAFYWVSSTTWHE